MARCMLPKPNFRLALYLLECADVRLVRLSDEAVAVPGDSVPCAGARQIKGGIVKAKVGTQVAKL
jgi:hypothetical protein